MRIFGIEFSRGRTMDALREGVAELERRLEDVGWVRVGQQDSDSFLQARESYDKMVRRCRLAYIKNPLVGQAVHLTTHYTFGQGISAPRSQDEATQEVIDAFWDDPDNVLSLSGPQVQIRLSNKLLVDGELCFLLQIDKNGMMYVRVLDPLSIGRVVRGRLDNMRNLFYERARANGGKQYIPDISNGAALMGEEAASAFAAQLVELDIPAAAVVPNAFIYQVKVNNDLLDSRGVPPVYRALDWINANSKIAGDMATFINVQSQYAVKKKITGTKAQVDAIAAGLRQNSRLTNPPRIPGIIAENQYVDNMPVALPSSSGELFENGLRRTLLMVCSAFGIMEHYFGDPSTGNLATATAMELPMLKAFQAQQKIWESVVRDIVNAMLDAREQSDSPQSAEFDESKNRMRIKDSAYDRKFTVDFPPILETDVKMLAEAYGAAKSQGLVPVETAQRMFMQGVGINDIDAELSKEFEEKPEPMVLQVPPGAQESLRERIVKRRDGWHVVSKAGKNLGGPYDTRQQAVKRLAQVEHFKEGADPASVRKAVRLADKNKRVLSKMRGYMREVGAAFRRFSEEVRRGTHVVEARPAVRNLDGVLESFVADMLRAARAYLPQAAALGAEYVRSRVAVKESLLVGEMSRLREQDEEFLADQLDWNETFVRGSLAPALKAKILKALEELQETEEAAKAAAAKAVASMEARVGAYVGAFWTVEERAVRRAAAEVGGQANFVGVEDDHNCAGCAMAIDGNPWPVDRVPVPGEQDCLGNCRHAIQLVGDEALTEADLQELAAAESEARAGYKLLEEAAVS